MTSRREFCRREKSCCRDAPRSSTTDGQSATHGLADDVAGTRRTDVGRSRPVRHPFAVDQIVEYRLYSPSRGSYRPFAFRHAAKSVSVCSIGRGIEAEDAAALADLLGDEILERGHLEGLIGDLIGEMRRDHDHAVAVAENDVAGKHRRVAAADRHVDLDRLMQRQVGRRARAVVIGGKAELCDLGGIAKAAVGDDAGDAALHQPRHQDGAGGRRAGILAAVHHQHRAGRAILDRLALRMGAVAKHVDLVEILARRHVAQRKGLADQGRLIRARAGARPGSSGCESRA